MENEIIERVARALFAEFSRQLDNRPVDLSDAGDLTNVMTFDAVNLQLTARAAIEAMREPIEPMWRMGADEHSGNDYFSPEDFPEEASRIYRAMIDAALAEGQPAA